MAEPTELQALYEHVDARHAAGVVTLFDTTFYRAQAAINFADVIEAALHYFGEGAAAGLDPNPFFDTGYYYSQQERLARRSVNALAHYVEHAPQGKACNPNPLFGNGFYLAANPELRGSEETPLAHYLRVGRLLGAPASRIQRGMFSRLGSATTSLRRGGWQNGRVLFFLQGSSAVKVPVLTYRMLAREHRLDSIAVVRERTQAMPEERLDGVLVLDDFRGECDVFRPSALRFLALALSSVSELTITDVPEGLEGASSAGAPCYFLLLEEASARAHSLPRVAARADRVIFGSRELVPVARQGQPHPHNVAVRQYDLNGDSGETGRQAAEQFVRALVDLARRDFGVRAGAQRNGARGPTATRRLVVPCSDWSVSGVNAALEAVGQELQRLGWEIEIIFTRDRALVEQSAGSEQRMPALPYRFLERRVAGAEGMWEALIADVERRAPCIVFMAYDFVANSTVPALTNDVGAVMWLQADDGDYYEQAYRLGRYCNAVVCVSQHIRETVAELHPGIAARAQVIHNTSVAEHDVAETRSPRADRLRIVYTGRLVQYQKRILDFIPLADALESRGVPFKMSLIGNFPVHDEAAGLFHERAAHHLETGTIELVGRLSRNEIFERLRVSDFFVLLSDFEGLPLSLVEAMAAGCVPVVAAMKSGIAELLASGENGLVVTGRDYGHWADTLVGLWRDPATLAAMSQQARATVRETFTIERIAQQFDELFQRVAQEIAAGYERPPALHWGERRSRTGDVLPPPFMYRSVPIAGLG